ncbi:hypothetical protein CEUSTIGMA_g10832.t1 [Chlamydomonas eustigma]|uniref:RRM domain-containing protein n=1 Tax=Chlamydomonas eustigma TaxID=1157962 RepID=A0A250XK10_9CHLO|nr:hypothetical protein CEUSTIGMA_g10832.t1 [Chlamydomonas eustigma]|eukprot:GAX83407.1 hypothetical protein CEUSTIGMA_g10832.t1 [Chlamydomonas eustigma]
MSSNDVNYGQLVDIDINSDISEVFSKLAVSERTSSSVPKSVSSEPSSILKLKGLPYAATERQIRDFFNGQIVKTVRFVFEPDGRPSGLAFAEFETREEALKALSKNGEFLGDRYVRLLHVPVTEMEDQGRMLYTTGPPSMVHSGQMHTMEEGSPMLSLDHQHPLGPRSVSLPLTWHQMYPQPQHQLQPPSPITSVPTSSISAPLTFMPSFAASSTDLRLQLLPQHSRTITAQPLQYSAPQHQYNNSYLTGPTQPLPMEMAPPSSQILSLTSRSFLPLSPLTQQQRMPPGGVVRSSGCTAKVRGLPYRSTPMEILGFFEGYRYLPDSLQIGLDSLGRPSGEAWLSFLSPEETMRAVQDLNRQYLGSRYLELSLC